MLLIFSGWHNFCVNTHKNYFTMAGREERPGRTAQSAMFAPLTEADKLLLSETLKVLIPHVIMY